ncbi:site-specific integrase [Nitrospirillum sp. BR 11164]|uniref:site-specific integrase n=1 Tax=Nitrospirillum sp. BR 11164 TaxID=3104324 RepID=UPI002AFE9343|nr:site-specific integrase [Nitrospirillum sp. BR 11164]MEA1648801.1 site-specific integrase [Nitrospirillum sp. BR 11164]
MAEPPALVSLETGLFGQLQVPAAGRDPADLAALSGRAAVYAAHARADNTRLAYRKAWAAYTTWCRGLGFLPVSGDPVVVGLYLTAAADRGLAVSTLRVHLAAIIAAHRLGGLALDVRHPGISAIMRGIERTKGRAPRRQAAPVLPLFLKAMVTGLPDNPAGRRDRALLLLGFGAATRRSELVALDRADVEIHPQGVTVLFRRSKTDQVGEGRRVAIHQAVDPAVCVRRALAAWLEVRSAEMGPLFVRIRKSGIVTGERLADAFVGRLLKRLAAGADLNPALYSGHSLRAGLATSAAIRGATIDRIMRQTGHRSYDAARRYVRDAELWRDNVTEGLVD